MDHEHLRKFFPLHPTEDREILEAQQQLRESANELAFRINKVVPEGQAKVEMLMRLMHLMRDINLALELDGVSKVTNMVVMH